MRESRTYGSVRGALSNERPYRDPGATRVHLLLQCMSQVLGTKEPLPILSREVCS
jgi:hypothetical protein